MAKLRRKKLQFAAMGHVWLFKPLGWGIYVIPKTLTSIRWAQPQGSIRLPGMA